MMYASPLSVRGCRACWRRLITVLCAFVFGLGVVEVVLTAAPAQAADLASTPLITWNMQGGYTQGNTKWAQVAAFLQYIPTPLMLLQEVGAGPPAEVLGQTQNLQIAAANNPANVYTVRHSQWRVGRFGILFDVYFLRTQAGGADGTGGRVNTAIVSARGADEVRVIENPNGRHLLGIRLGNTWYYTIHAQAGNGGQDGPGLLQTVANLTPPGEQWVVGGDFNRSPEDLAGANPPLPNPSQVYRTREATHESGNELDYVVASQNVADLPVTRVGGFLSDHYPVMLGALRAAAEPTIDAGSPTSTAQAIESMQAGGVIDVAGGRTGNNSGVITYHRDRGANQAWYLDIYDATSPAQNTVRFRGPVSNRCLDILNSDSATAGRQLVIFDCKDGVSQQWTLEDLGDSQVRVHSALRPDLCMNVAGGRNTPDGPPMIVWPCTNDTNERFFLTPADTTGVPRQLDPYGAADNAPGARSVESMQAGGVIDVAGGRTGNNSPVITYHLDRGTNQGWNITQRDDHAVQFRGTGSSRCLDIYNSTTATAGRQLVVFDCKAGDSQWWTVEDLGNQQVRFHSALRPDLCMNVAGAPNTPDGPPMIVWPCTNDTNERFTFTPYDPSGAPIRDHDEL